jgi:hypothetical protein
MRKVILNVAVTLDGLTNTRVFKSDVVELTYNTGG